MKPELRFETKKMMSSDLGPQACVPDLIGEHILQNDTKFDLGEHDEIYEGFGRKRSAYPYRQYNSYTRELKEKDIKIAVLENDYLKAVFLPEYGGRLGNSGTRPQEKISFTPMTFCVSVTWLSAMPGSAVAWSGTSVSSAIMPLPPSLCTQRKRRQRTVFRFSASMSMRESARCLIRSISGWRRTAVS